MTDKKLAILGACSVLILLIYLGIKDGVIDESVIRMGKIVTAGLAAILAGVIAADETEQEQADESEDKS